MRTATTASTTQREPELQGIIANARIATPAVGVRNLVKK